MKILPVVWLLLWFLALAGWPDHSVAAPVELNFEENRLRTDGILHRLREKVEKFDREWTLFDMAGKRYHFDGRTLSTYLYDDNINLSIPSTEEAAFVLARAKAFETKGLQDQAAELYSALRAMDGRYFPVTADISSAVRNAKDLPYTAPIVLTHKGILHIISEDTGFHLKLPFTEPCRLLREDTIKTENITSYVLRLSSQKRQYLIFFDKFLKTTSAPDRGSYMVLSDLRRGFDLQRKDKTDFSRSCDGSLCTVLYKEKGLEKGWLEWLNVRPQSGFVLAISPPVMENRSYMEAVIKNAF